MTTARRWFLILPLCACVADDPLDDVDGDADESEVATTVLVNGVDVPIPSPFVGIWFNNRRVELPLGMHGLQLAAGDTLDPGLAEVGNLLFFDRRLSSNDALACASCHSPATGYSATTFTRGVQGNVLPRTASTAMNRAFGTLNTWSGERTLEEQASAPITNPAEMGLTRAQLVARVAAVPGYVDRLNRLVAAGVIPAPAVSVANLERAIATFERLSLMTGGSRVDRYQAGDASALNATERLGRLLFQTQARCVLCHRGPNFTDEDFHHIIVVRNGDLGRAAVTGQASDRGKFKTPSLRNVALRRPYFHNGDPIASTGLATTVAEVVRRYNAGPPSGEPNEDPLIVRLGMSFGEIAAVGEFLEALTGSIPVDPWLSTAGTSTSSPDRESIYLSPAIFDASEYQAAYPDLAAMTAAQVRRHWLTTGMAAGRIGVATFSVDEYIELYPPVHDAVAGSPNARLLAFDDYLDTGRRIGRVGRFVLSRQFFKVQDYRTLNGRPTLLLPEAAAIAHYMTAGQAQRRPSAVAPQGYFMIVNGSGATYHYADGTSRCRFASAAAQRASRGRGDDVGVPRLGFAPVNLQDGGACRTATSPPTPSVPPVARSGAIVAFQCRRSVSNAACSVTAICPAGMAVRATRAACNLEFGTVSQAEVGALPWNHLAVVRASDVVSDGHCRIDAIDISTGSLGLLPPIAPDRVVAGCAEHDSNGGDCHIKGELLCSP